MFGKGKKRKIWRKILDIFSGLKKSGKKDAPKVRDNKKAGNFRYDFFGFGDDILKNAAAERTQSLH